MLTSSVLALASLAVLLALFGRWRQDGYHLVGPHFFCDLVRLARRGRSSLLRCSYALVLLLGLCAVFMARFPQVDLLREPFDTGLRMSPNALSQFGRAFVQAIVVIQGLALLVLTPAYLAGAVADEKQANTLELMFTTDLRNREIVLGKLLGRLLHVAGVLLACLPVLSLTMLWGGVDFAQLLAVSVVTALSLLSVGSISIMCSVLARQAITAVVGSYAMVFVMMTCCWLLPISRSMSPITFLFEFDQRLLPKTPVGATPMPSIDAHAVLQGMLIESVASNGLMSAICVGLAILLLRDLGLPRDDDPARAQARLPPKIYQRPVRSVRALPSQAGRGPDTAKPVVQRATKHSNAAKPAVQAATKVLAHSPPRWRAAKPGIGDNPLLWKELYQGKVYEPATFEQWVYGFAVFSCGMTFLVMGAKFAVTPNIDSGLLLAVSEWLTPTVRVLLITCALCWCVPAAMRAAQSLSRERESKTLASLLMLPVGRNEILSAKWLGSILRHRALGVLLLAGLGFGLATGALHPWAVLLVCFSCLSQLAFLASAGLWVSLASRNSMWSSFTMALLLLVFFLVPWFVPWLHLYPLSGQDDVPPILGYGLNPINSLWFCSFSWAEFVTGIQRDPALLFANLGCCLLGSIVQALLGCFFWLLATRRFRNLAT